eukprot:CAMPEP_0181447786 /NCGR_PEP_ID=MMETSP1110-20121109/26801_1 /TAXON_ID=174948 /ORGANISM="Symbiodinium sp., Strain CCMP421" /LENGTH=55 /DNA_ID=CAMNT_0023571909 /DNA_START=1028 /DNA_END=1192 /DNA_ORIENTATION=-
MAAPPMPAEEDLMAWHASGWKPPAAHHGASRDLRTRAPGAIASAMTPWIPTKGLL